MNLDKCTDDQRAVVTTLDRPLMVSAGAGSGKTFTLTQRVAFALMSHRDAQPFLQSIDEVLAITFTTKAADELKSRIKGLLLDEHLDDEALKVDEAWISTIHGMASRILREHALEIGLDPAFEVISEIEAERLMDEALEQVVLQARHNDDKLVAELLRTEKLKGESFSDNGVVDYARDVLDRVYAMPKGFDALDYRSRQSSPSSIVRRLVEAAEELLAVGRTWNDKPPKTTLEFLSGLEAAIEGANRWLADAPDASFGDEGFDAESFCSVFYAFKPKPSHLRENYRESFEPWWEVLYESNCEVRANLALRWQEAIVRVARQVDRVYGELKGPSRLDNTDLLVRCSRALKDNQDIAEALKRKFKLIMVDEFQDTDRLQVDVISRIAQPGLANVCTVGDAQQSIYRFRGADVNVFFEYRKNLEVGSSRDAVVEMKENFRSHGDILAFVERIFGAQEVFGDDFLKLQASGPVNTLEDGLFEHCPRVQVDVTHYTGNESKDDARKASAREIAAHFADLVERGAHPGDMVVLLGAMSHADVYSDALREAGIASVITGGSVFSRMEEPKLIARLLRVAVNRNDEEALYAAVASDFFAVPDDVLLVLATRMGEDGERCRQSIARGLYAESLADDLASAGLSDSDIRAALLCRNALRTFCDAARSRGVAYALRRLLVQTGLLDRLQDQGVEGVARAGNYAKSLRLVEQFEEQCPGVASVAESFEAHLGVAKEAPGSLVTTQGDFVRIMTVHASKGLEFPHVAVAELKDGKEKSSRLVAENIGQGTYLSTSFVPLQDWKGASDAIAKACKAQVEAGIPCLEECEADTLGELLSSLPAGIRHEALSTYAQNQGLAEARRLLYVALTRASKSLFVSLLFSSKPESGYEDKGVLEDIFRATPWEPSGSYSVTMADYGGSAPARLVCRVLGAEEELGGEEPGKEEVLSLSGGVVDRASQDDDASVFAVPRRDPLPDPVLLPRGFAHDGLFSYSSISGTHAHTDEPVSQEQPSGATFEIDVDAGGMSGEPLADASSSVLGEDATALGRAFHRLAQQAIERSAGGTLFVPGDGAVESQIRKEQLSENQQRRLRAALDRWLASPEAACFASYGNRSAEVPFTVEVPLAAAREGGAGVGRVSAPGTQPFFLEGEIDGLADNGDGAAFLIDYKTGGSPAETPEQLDAKHCLQASCYAYALMRAGYTSVDAHFLRIEHPSPDDPRNPQIVPYHFESADLPALEALIIGKQQEATA